MQVHPALRPAPHALPRSPKTRNLSLAPCNCAIQQQTRDYLTASLGQLIPMFEFAKQGAFDTATPEAKAFTAERLAVAATMLRDMVADAWTESGKATLGYKTKMTVAELEAGTADPRKLE